jgi:hypothetical protein
LMAKGMKNLWPKYGFRINYVMGKSIWTLFHDLSLGIRR